MWSADKHKNRSGHDADIYGIALRIIRHYPQDKAMLENMLHESPAHDGQPRGSNISSPVESIAIRRERLKIKVDAVEWALNQIPAEYRKGLMISITRRRPFPHDAHVNTYKYWKEQLVWGVARKMGDI